MYTFSRRIAPAALCAAALVALTPAAAPAQAKPTPCGGKLLITDAGGDQAHRQQNQVVFATPPSTDVLGVFFLAQGDKVTANLVVDDVPAAPPSGFFAIRYRMYFTVDGTVRFVQALVTASGPQFSYGSEFEVSYTEDGKTEGTLFGGKQGVVQVVIPADAGGKPGTEFKATSGTAGLLSANVPPEGQLAPFYFQADTAPDGSADGPDTRPVACEPAPPAAGPVAPVKPAAAALKLSAAGKVSARKANSKRSASLVLSASERLTGLTAQLKRGKAVVGTGSLKQLSGKGTLKLKLKGKLRKGAHKLVVRGKRASGAAFTATLNVKVAG